MRTTRGRTGLGGGNPPEQPIDKNEARELYLEHFELAMGAYRERDHYLFDKHYRLAEYYQKLLTPLDAASSTAPSKMDNVTEESFPPYNWRQFILKGFVFEPKGPLE